MGNLDMDLKNRWPHKFTLSEIQCASGHLMLDRVDSLNSLRIKRAEKFIKNFEGKTLSFNQSFVKRRHVYHLLSAYVRPSKKINNHKIIRKLYDEYGIKCAVQYYPLYRYPLFKKMGLSKNKCPNTNIFYDNMISFPFHVWMSDNDFNYIIKSLKKVIRFLEA